VEDHQDGLVSITVFGMTKLLVLGTRSGRIVSRRVMVRDIDHQLQWSQFPLHESLDEI